MSKDSTQTADPAELDDEIPQGYQTATFGFFQRHQKTILFSAVLFALVSFSITGALLGFFDWVVKDQRPGPTMTVGGETIQVQPEDQEVARMITSGAWQPVPVLDPMLVADDRLEVYAALRRLAIHAGIEPSMTEVDRAIARTVESLDDVDNAASLAAVYGPPGRRRSAGELRLAVAEAMRISTYMRLAVLSVDTSEQVVLDDLLENGEMLTFDVATLDKKALEKTFEADLDEDGETLKEWIAGLDDNQKRANGFLGPDRVRPTLIALPFEAFSPTPFAAELADLEISEGQIKDRTDRIRGEREARERAAKDEDNDADADGGGDGVPEDAQIPKKPGDGGPGGSQSAPTQSPETQDPETQDPETQKPETQNPESGESTVVEDPDRKAARRQLEAEAVLNQVWQKIRDAQTEFLAEAYEAVTQAASDRTTAETTLRDAKAAAEAEPENESLAEAVTAAEADVEAKKAAADAAQDALDAKRLEFDAAAALRDVMDVRADLFQIVTYDEPKGVDEFQDLGELGTWNESWGLGQMRTPGELSSLVSRSDKAAFHFQVHDIVRNPELPFEDIAEKAKEAYLRTKADEDAKAKREAFEEALLELGKQKMGERLAELEGERETRITEQLDAWRAEVEAEEQAAQAEVDRLSERGVDQRSNLFTSAVARLTAATEARGKEEARRTEITEEVGTAIEAEIEEAAKEHYGEVLAEAAAQAGWEVSSVGPLRKTAMSDPWFKREASELEKFVAGIATQIDEAGDSTGIRDNFMERTSHLAICTDVSPIDASALTRKDFVRARQRNMAGSRYYNAARVAFSLDQLKKRYGWKESSRDEGKAPTNSSAADEE